MNEKIYIHNFIVDNIQYEHVYFNGVVAYKQSNQNRKRVWMEGYENELKECETRSQLQKKIKSLQGKVYSDNRRLLMRGKGFNDNQIRLCFTCKSAGWKYEELYLKLRLINDKSYPRDLFKRLSKTKSRAKFDRLANRWGLKELFESFDYKRVTNYCDFIYHLKQ